MKIALVAQTYGPANGPGAFVASLARGLAARGDEVTVVAPSETRRTRVGRDGAVVVAGVRAWSLAPLWPEVRVTFAPARPLARLLDELAPDVVHLHDHYPLCASAARACAARGLPMIATNHFVPENIVPHVPVVSRSRAGRRALERVLWAIVARVFRRAAIVTTPTETAAERIRPRLGARDLRAISCGVELERFARAVDRDAVRASLGLSPPDRVVVYVGRLDVEKRVDVLVRAFAKLERRDARLLLVGRGRCERALRGLARDLGAAPRVLFAGFAPPERVVELLGASDIFAMPGDVELQSIATLEAMAASLPVLAAGSGALPELVTGGVHGALFRANDAGDAAARLRELLDAPAAWPAMSRACRARALEHDARRTVDAYRALYASVT